MGNAKIFSFLISKLIIFAKTLLRSVDRGVNYKPNLIELEVLRTELFEKVFNGDSLSGKMTAYCQYFQKILQYKNANIEEAFLKEFIEDYIRLLNKFEVWGVKPEFSNILIHQLKDIKSLKIAEEFQQGFNKEIERIENQVHGLKQVLEGKESKERLGSKAFFPLIDQKAPAEFYGVIDSVTIKLSKGDEANKSTSAAGRFIIVPSEKEIETRIIEQCENSWTVALNLASRYIKKTYPYHEIIISFDKKIGFYEGNSLGIALTLTMLEGLLKFYNPEYIIKIKDSSAFTGGVDEKGKVLETGEEIIKQKVNAIFFSELNTFIFPKLEESYAHFALTQLKIVYPNRNLKLIPVEDINDVINRRDVVDIRKQKIVVRTGKFVKKNWISAIVTVLLAILFAFLFVMDFDNNPVSYSLDGENIFIKNKNGRILWNDNFKISPDMMEIPFYTKKFLMITDTDNDGVNEIFEVRNKSLICYDNKKVEKWRYRFDDEIYSNRELLNREYNINIIDTITIENTKRIFMIAANGPSFGSAIFNLDCKTGHREKGTFWAAGHIMGGIIQKNGKENFPHIVGAGYDNGYEDLVLFKYRFDTLTQVRKTTENYLIRGYPLANLDAYIRFPKTDFDNLYNTQRTPQYYYASQLIYNIEDSTFNFGTGIPEKPNIDEAGYYIKDNFKDINIVISSGFRVARDSLVARGKLTLPYTDTEEYKENLKNNILYWNEGKWVNRYGVEKK